MYTCITTHSKRNASAVPARMILTFANLITAAGATPHSNQIKRLLFCLFILCPALASAQVLNEKQLGKMKTNWQDPKGRKKYTLDSSFGRRTISKRTDLAKLKKYVSNKQVPFLVTVSFYEYIKAGDGYKRLALRDRMNVYIMNSKGKVVFKKTRSANELIPYSRGRGGLLGDVPSEGIYTAVAWVKKNNIIFGRKMTINLKAFQQSDLK